jgi:Mrp family chromosome partitioning ATPase/capsular polysaccharide biosynthesis protein
VSAEDGRTPETLADYLRLLKRRKWVFIATALAVPVIAVALSVRSPPTYEGSAKVLLTQQNGLGASQGAVVDPTRAAQTQADLARVQEVVRAAVADIRVKGLTSDALLEHSSVAASPGSDFLAFSAKDSDPDVADRLAMAYARAYVDYRFKLDSHAIARARNLAERQKKELEAAGLGSSAEHRSLEQQLGALNGTPVPTLVVLRASDGAVKVGPPVTRNGGIALILGIVLGLALAFLWDLLDTRVRSLDTVRNALPRLALLGRLPAPARALRERGRLVMLTAPTSLDAEPIRVLRANFEFAVREVGAKTIMFTSGVGGEGKSTTVANLAVALARGGRQVVLVDFDTRNPGLHRFFGLDGIPGLIDVSLYDAPIETALADVRPTYADGPQQLSQSVSPGEGRLELLPLGRAPHDPDQVRADVIVRQIIDQIRERADYILIDAGPLLPTGDAIALSAQVDAIVPVVRLRVLPLSALDDLARTLESSPAAKVGFVVTAAEETAQQSRYSGSPRRAERGGEWEGTYGEGPRAEASSALTRPQDPAAPRPAETDGWHESGDPMGLPEHLLQMPSATSKQELLARLKAAQFQHDIVVAGTRVGDSEGFTAPDIAANMAKRDMGPDRRALSRRVLAAINDRLIPHGLVVDTGTTRMTPEQMESRKKNPRAGGRPARLFQVTEQGKQAVGLVNEQQIRRGVPATGANRSYRMNGAVGSSTPEEHYKVYRRREGDEGQLGWEEVAR